MLGEICALVAALTWSVSVVLFKRSEAASAQSMNLFKNATATVLLLATMPLLQIGVDWERSGEDWFRLVSSGVLGIAVADTLIFVALKRLGAGLLAVVDCAYAPVIVSLGIIVLGEPFGLTFAIGAVLVVGGVLAAAGQKTDERAVRGRALLHGVLIGVAGIVAMAVGVILAKPALERGHLVEVSLVRLVAGVVSQSLWVIVWPSQRSAFSIFKPSKVWRTLVPASILGSYVAMLLWLGGFKWANASTAAVLNQLSSVFTIVLARIYLGEAVTPRRAVGAGAAVVGALLILL